MKTQYKSFTNQKKMRLELINIITAVISFGILMIFNIYISPLLKKLRFIWDGSETDSGRDALPVSGGILPAAASFTSSAAVYAVIRAVSEIDVNSVNSHKLLFSGQIIILLGFACGFYSDLLKSRGKKGGMSKGVQQIFICMLCISFLILKFIFLPDERAVKIPFSGEYNLRSYYYPLCFAVMLVTFDCVSFSGESSRGAAMAAMLFSGISSLSVSADGSIFSAALSGAFTAFFFLNFPRVNILAGKSGSLFMGMAAAEAAVSSDNMIYILIMLIPFYFARIKNLLPKKQTADKNIRYDKKTVLTTAAYFAFSAVCVLAASALSKINAG